MQSCFSCSLQFCKLPLKAYARTKVAGQGYSILDHINVTGRRWRDSLDRLGSPPTSGNGFTNFTGSKNSYYSHEIRVEDIFSLPVTESKEQKFPPVIKLPKNQKGWQGIVRDRYDKKIRKENYIVEIRKEQKRLQTYIHQLPPHHSFNQIKTRSPKLFVHIYTAKERQSRTSNSLVMEANQENQVEAIFASIQTASITRPTRQPKCYVIEHEENKCKHFEQELMVEKMTEVEFQSWKLHTEEGRAYMTALGEPVDGISKQHSLIHEENPEQANKDMTVDFNKPDRGAKRQRDGEVISEEESAGNFTQTENSAGGVNTSMEYQAANEGTQMLERNMNTSAEGEVTQPQLDISAKLRRR